MISTAWGREIDRARRALRFQRLEDSEREDPFAAIIRCTADPAKADKRTRSKWSKVMRYAAAYKPDSEALNDLPLILGLERAKSNLLRMQIFLTSCRGGS